ncbi:hypothetical protein JCM17960_32440 [Magnetospira thiophila]
MRSETWYPAIPGIFNPAPMGLVVRRFLLYFLPITAGLIGIFLLYEASEHEQNIAMRLTNERAQLQLYKTLMERDLEILVGDLFVLADSSDLRRMVDDPTEEHRRELEHRFLNFASDRRQYDQIRYLDETGQEVVRVNYNDGRPSGVLQRNLQNKADRYYFKQTQALGDQEVYISPLDLNIENGQIEHPLKPMLRVAMPLRDASGRRRGILILNYLAKIMLHRLTTQLADEEKAKSSITNSQGYWLHHPNPQREWGFALEHGESFARDDPEAWRLMIHSDQGQVKSAGGVYTYAKVRPLAVMMSQFLSPMSDLGAVTGQSDADSRFWIIMTRLDPEELRFTLAQVLEDQIMLAALFGLLLFSAFGIWQMAQSRILREQSETYLRVLSLGLEQSPAAIMITNASGLIEYINGRFTQITGYGPSEMIGHNPRILKSGETAPEEYGRLWDTITRGETWRGEFHNRRKNGTHFWAKAQISPIHDAQGRITHFIGVQEDISEKRELQKNLKTLSALDPLTGVYNRRQFFTLVEAEVARSRRQNHPMALMMMDLDHFNNINTKYGYPAGDAALVGFVEVLRPYLRAGDILCRFSGKEFAVALPETTMLDAVALAERLRQKVADYRVAHAGLEFGLTVSIGCAAWTRSEPTLEAALHRAEDALAVAQQGGGNRVISK